MTCPSRYLTATGDVLHCLLPHGPTFRNSPMHASDFDATGQGQPTGQQPLHWFDGDPCAWQADPCPDCGGRGWVVKHGPVDRERDPCPSCGGSGVDDSIPVRIIHEMIRAVERLAWPKPSHRVPPRQEQP